MKGQCSWAQVHSEKEDLSAELQELDQQLRAVAEEQEDVHTKIYGSEWTPGYAQSARTLLEMLVGQERAESNTHTLLTICFVRGVCD